jgi:hypothetical protein
MMTTAVSEFLSICAVEAFKTDSYMLYSNYGIPAPIAFSKQKVVHHQTTIDVHVAEIKKFKIEFR